MFDSTLYRFLDVHSISADSGKADTRILTSLIFSCLLAAPSLSSHFTLYLISSFQTTLGEHSKHNYYGAEFINYAAVPFHSKCSL